MMAPKVPGPIPRGCLGKGLCPCDETGPRAGRRVVPVALRLPPSRLRGLAMWLAGLLQQSTQTQPLSNRKSIRESAGQAPLGCPENLSQLLGFAGRLWDSSAGIRCSPSLCPAGQGFLGKLPQF